MTTKGRKTRMAAMQPKVSFQLDTASTTGPFGWQSVTGEGTFEVVTAAPEIEAVAALLTTRFPEHAGLDARRVRRAAEARRRSFRARATVEDGGTSKRARLTVSTRRVVRNWKAPVSSVRECTWTSQQNATCSARFGCSITSPRLGRAGVSTRMTKPQQSTSTRGREGSE